MAINPHKGTDLDYRETALHKLGGPTGKLKVTPVILEIITAKYYNVLQIKSYSI